MATKFTRAQEEKVSDPLPLGNSEVSSKSNDHRIWIGNVDVSVNEYSLLQLLKKFGSIKELDYLFHKAGPLQGKSKGFHFASFYNRQDAQSAIDGLNGTIVLSKSLQVRWAHQQQATEKKAPVNINLKTDLVVEEKQSPVNSNKHHSKTAMISSIEKKLKEMERKQDGNSSGGGGGLHPLLQQSKANMAAADARKRAHPYRKSRRR